MCWLLRVASRAAVLCTGVVTASPGLPHPQLPVGRTGSGVFIPLAPCSPYRGSFPLSSSWQVACLVDQLSPAAVTAPFSPVSGLGEVVASYCSYRWVPRSSFCIPVTQLPPLQTAPLVNSPHRNPVCANFFLLGLGQCSC